MQIISKIDPFFVIKNFCAISSISMGLALNSVCLAAPHPGVATSALSRWDRNFFLSAAGFSLDLRQQNWEPQESLWPALLSDTSETGPKINLTFEKSSTLNSEKKLKLVLSVQSHLLSKDMTLEAYARNWIKDFPSYGFELLGTRTFQESGQRGLVMDVQMNQHQKKARQTIFIKDRRAVLITCVSHKENFEDDLSSCNQVTKSFSWLKGEPQSKSIQ